MLVGGSGVSILFSSQLLNFTSSVLLLQISLLSEQMSMSRRAAIKLLTPAQLVALPPKATAILDASWHSQSSISVPA